MRGGPRSKLGADDRHEARLLLAILAERWADVEARVAEGTPRGAVLVELARTCAVHPWLHQLLTGCEERAGLDRVAARRLAALRRQCRLDNLLLLAWTERALDVLLSAGVVPIVLKGLALIHRHGIEFDARTFDDIDILVAPRERAKALRALECAGWKAPRTPPSCWWSAYHVPLTTPGPLPVVLELHHGLVQEGRYALAPEELLGRAIPFELAGRRVLGLDIHDAAAHLLLHHVSHHFPRQLKWWLDLWTMTRAPDFRWSIVAERLADWGGLAAGAAAIAHLEKLFPALVTDEVRRFFPTSRWRMLLARPLRSPHPLELYRGTRHRIVQLALSALFLERPLSFLRFVRPVATLDRVYTSSVRARSRYRS